MTTERDFLGKGWRFPVATNLTGGLSMSSHEDNIRESLFIILGTAPGERLNRPQFGCRIHDLVFAPNNSVTCSLAEFYCEEALLKFEPRISDATVKAESSKAEPNRINLRVTFVVADTNEERNLVYPFYLSDDEDEG